MQGNIYIIASAAFAGGLIIALFVFAILTKIGNNRRRKAQHAAGEQIQRRKLEFSKVVLTFVLLTYFIGVGVGVKITFIDISQLAVLLAFIGTPTAAAIGFYIWKAKAENIIKIKKDNPEETAGVPVDVNNINP